MGDNFREPIESFCNFELRSGPSCASIQAVATTVATLSPSQNFPPTQPEKCVPDEWRAEIERCFRPRWAPAGMRARPQEDDRAAEKNAASREEAGPCH